MRTSFDGFSSSVQCINCIGGGDADGFIFVIQQSPKQAPGVGMTEICEAQGYLFNQIGILQFEKGLQESGVGSLPFEAERPEAVSQGYIIQRTAQPRLDFKPRGNGWTCVIPLSNPLRANLPFGAHWARARRATLGMWHVAPTHHLLDVSYAHNLRRINLSLNEHLETKWVSPRVESSHGLAQRYVHVGLVVSSSPNHFIARQVEVDTHHHPNPAALEFTHPLM